MPYETTRLAPNHLRKNDSLRFSEDASNCKGLQVLNYQLSNLNLTFFFLLKESQMQESAAQWGPVLRIAQDVCRPCGILTLCFPLGSTPAHGTPTSFW